MTDADDFGGTDTPAKTREQDRAERFARGQCRNCSNPVKKKRNGSPCRVCVECAAADTKRKK